MNNSQFGTVPTRAHGREGSIRVLHVDDDTAFAELVAEYLERTHDEITVLTEHSVIDALDRLSTDAVDCIVSDYEMPCQDGLAFLDVVRERYPDLPFIFFTGSGNENITREALRLGATDYFQKREGTDQYTVLATQIEAHVEKYRENQRSGTASGEGQQAGAGDVQASHCLAIVDVDRDSYPVDWVNQACEDMTGRGGRELRGQPVADAFPAETGDFLVAMIDRCIETQSQVSNTAAFPIPEPGTQYDINVSPISRDEGDEQAALSMRDVTERERQNEMLQQERQQFKAILDNVPIITYQVDTDGTIILSKGHGLSHFDRKPDELVGTSVFESFSEYDEIIDAYRRALDGEYVEKTVCVDGAVLDEWYRPVFDANGDVASVVGVSVDVTKREQQQQQLQREIERLDEFASIVSHDLRNPLNVALGRLELVQEEYESEHLTAISDSLDRIEALIVDILALAREGRVVDKKEPVAIRSLVEDCWSTVPAPAATITIETDAVIYADRSRFKQLFENLFRNSVEHGGEDVTITVGTFDTGFYVEDDGKGIPADKQADVFETGYTTSTDGTGFGLSIVSDIVTAHGWDIAVTEGTAGGARFEISGVRMV